MADEHRGPQFIRFPCPYLGSEVELTQERADHIAREHPDLFPRYAARIPETLLEPDLVRQDPNRPDGRQFIRFYGNLNTLVAVIVTAERNFVSTAFFVRRVPRGGILWKRQP